jgi:ABC-type antimicrobial peptide transport system permease subunit
MAAAGNPGVPVGSVVHLDTLVRESVSAFRSTTWLFLSFAGVALLLAATGIYGLVSYSVAQRSYEISIRMAIGATRGSILRAVLMRSLRVALLGTIAGLSAAFLTVRGLSAMLYSVAPTDPVVYVSVSAFLLCTTLLASLVPAWRAARMDPVRTLRAD